MNSFMNKEAHDDITSSERAPDIVLGDMRRCGFRLEPDLEAERMGVQVLVVSDAGRKRARLLEVAGEIRTGA